MRPQSRLSPGISLIEIAVRRGRALCSALGMESRSDELAQICELVMQPWGRAPVAAEPEWQSNVVDDGTPFEFSIAYDRRPELRLLLEPLGSPPSLPANIGKALELLASLARDYRIDLSRFVRIVDLFLPDRPQGSFGIWLAVVMRETGAPEFKLYLNPQSSGAANAPVVIGEALDRLGFDRAWPVIGKVLTRRGSELDELKYFALDLERSPEARVKVYARHHASDLDVLVSAAAGCPSCRPELVRRFLAAVSPDRSEFPGRGPFTCYAFVTGDSAPSSVTTHFPINGYARNDEIVSRRVRACLHAFSIPIQAYDRTLGVIATRPLEQGIGLNSYVSFRHHRDEPRITLYLPCEVYAPGTVEHPATGRRSSGVMERAVFRGLDLAHHPFVARMLRDEDLAPLLHLIQGVDVALGDQKPSPAEWARELAMPGMPELVEVFVKAPAESCKAQAQWLASVAEMLRAERLDGLGRGSLDAGQRLQSELRTRRRAGNPYRRIGVAFASALLAGEACTLVGQRLQGHPALPRLPTLQAAPTWSLDADTAEEARAEILCGVSESAKAAWAMLDDLYEVNYVLGR